MSNNIYGAIALKNSSGALDQIDGVDLSIGDIAIVVTADGTYFYSLISSSDTENSPALIQPSLNGLTKRWAMTSVTETTSDFTILGKLITDKISFTGSTFTINAGSTPLATFNADSLSVSFNKISSVIDSSVVTGLNAQYVGGKDGALMMLSNGSVPFTGPVTGTMGSVPTSASATTLATKSYIDAAIALINNSSIGNYIVNNILTASTITSKTGQDLVLQRGGSTVATFDSSGAVTFNKITSVTDTNMVNNLNAQYLGGVLNTAFVRTDGSVAFTGVVGGVTPTLDAHLATKAYVDAGGSTNLSSTSRAIGGVAYKNISGIACAPSLELTAADYLNSTNGAPSTFTFTRNSIATAYDQVGILTTYAVNELRHDHDPVTGAYKGWLIEPTCTNLLTYSEQMANAAWVFSGSRTSDSTTAPDGTTTADTVVLTSTYPQIYQASSTNASNGTSYTFSIWLKLVSGGPNVTLAINRNGGLDGQTSANLTLTTSWQRFTFTHDSSWTGTSSIQVMINRVSNDCTFYAWGAQLETGVLATSYIQSVGTNGVRQADALSIPIANFPYNASEGTLYVEGATVSLVGNTWLGNVSDGTVANMIGVFASSTDIDGYISNSSAQMANAITNTLVVGTFYRTSVAYKLNNSNFALNGVNATADTTCTIPIVTTLYIGTTGAGVATNSWIKQVAYFPRRLSDAELVLLTK